MATLKIQLPGNGTKVYRIHKKLTSLGRGAEADVALPDPSLSDSPAHIHFDGREFNLAATDRDAEIFVNGRKRQKQKLAHEDRIRIGSVELEFSLYDQPGADETAGGGDATELASYKKLYEFSGKLMESYELPTLVDQLLDVMIQVSNADKGFLVLMESGEPVVKAARNLRRETISDAVSQLSDSILAHVIKTRQPLIISDALHDEAFKNSLSVVNLKLTSVMCVPLLERGNMLGVIYVGNDNVAELFAASHLEVLSVFAAQASLLVRNALLVNELKLDNRSLQSRIEQIRFGEIIGSAPRMQEIFRKVQKVAATDISVLITGETGHRQGAHRARAPQPVTTRQAPVRHHQLRRHPREPARVRAVRARARRVHRRGRQRAGAVSVRRPRHALPGRDRRDAAVAAGQAPARPAGAGGRPRRRHPRREDRHPRRRGDQPRPGGGDEGGALPRGSLLPAQRREPDLPPLRDRGDDIIVLARSMVGRYAPEYGGQVRGLTPTPSPPSSATAGRATSGSSRTASRRRSCWATAPCSARRISTFRPTTPSILPLDEAKESSSATTSSRS